MIRQLNIFITAASGLLLLLPNAHAGSDWDLSEMVTEQSGKVQYHALPVPEELQNK